MNSAELATVKAIQAKVSSANQDLLALIASQPPPVQRLLGPADLSYQGLFYSPLIPGPDADTLSYGGQGLTLRKKADGTKSLFTWGIYGQKLFELSIPTPNKDANLAPRCALIKAWGDITQGKRVWPDGLGNLQSYGLAFTDANTLWSTFTRFYTVTDSLNPSLLKTVFNADGTVTTSGPYQIAGQDTHLTSGYCFKVPPKFGMLGCGSGPVAGAGYCSFPFSFVGVDGSFNGTRQILYPVGNRLARDGSYVQNTGYDSDPVNGVGASLAIEGAQSAAFIDAPNSQCLLFAGTFISGTGLDGATWYGDPTSTSGVTAGAFDGCDASKGLHATKQGRHDRLWFVDANALDGVNLRPAAVTADPNTLASPSVLPAVCWRNCTGIAVDEDTWTIYMCVPQRENYNNIAPLPMFWVWKIVNP